MVGISVLWQSPRKQGDTMDFSSATSPARSAEARAAYAWRFSSTLGLLLGHWRLDQISDCRKLPSICGWPQNSSVSSSSRPDAEIHINAHLKSDISLGAVKV